MSRHVLSASLVCAVVLGSGLAHAQQPAGPTRVRGTIEKVDGPMLTVKSRDGSEMQLRVPANVSVSGIVRIALSEVKPGAYIGVAALPQADGSQKALSVHIFPENMRGTAEGFRPWDLRPNSTMTNATVDQRVTANDGEHLTMKYKDGEKTVVVPPETPVVTYVPGTAAELVPGAKIIANLVRKEDGVLEAPRISVGRDGLTPPM
jgi:hypothetical protein